MILTNEQRLTLEKLTTLLETRGVWTEKELELIKTKILELIN